MTRCGGWPRRRAFGMVDRLGSATAGCRVAEWEEMSMSNESILVILLVGLIAGWLAGQIVRGTGYGLVADICIGIIGPDDLVPCLYEAKVQSPGTRK